MFFHSSRVRYLLTGFYGSSLVTARVKLQSRIVKPYRLRFAIYKWSKHGQTCLSIPDCDHAFDLTIFMDIHRNPGPNYTASNLQEFEFRVNHRNEANLHASTRSSICHSSEQLLNIHRVWSTYLTGISRNHLLFGYSRQYADSNPISHLGNDGRRQIETVVSNRSAQPMKINYSKSDTVHRSRNLNNLISINRLPFQPSKPSTKLLQFCVLNARSINNKTLHIKDYVVDNKIDILAITETWLKSDDDCYFTIRDICPQDYVFNHIPRTTGTGGGVGLLFKKNLKIKKLQTRTFRSFELMEVLLHTRSLTTRIVVVYRPPPSSINGLTSPLFFTEFSSFLEPMVSSPGKLLIVGDFNFAVNNGNDGAALNFLDLLNTFNLTQHIKVPTHKDNNILDLIITREDELTATNFSVHDPVISDHLALHCNLHVDKPQSIKKRINYRKFRSINTDDFQHDIVNSALYSSPKTVLAELSDQYDSVLSSILDKHAPLQTKTVIQRPAAPWYSEEIATEKTQRRKLERRWRHSGLLTDRQAYVTQCLLLKNLIFTTKMDYYSSLIDDAGSDSKALFRNINRLLHRKPDKLYPSCTSASDLANNFANFFTEKIATIKEQLASRVTFSPTVTLFDTPKLDCELTTLSLTTVKELSEIIGKTASKSCCLDPLPSRLLVPHLNDVLPVICKMVNLSLETGSLPPSLKEAVLSPLLKKPSLDHETLANFRPISNLKMVSKIIEKVVAVRLNRYLEENNLNEPLQSAYKQYHSCETALVRVQNDILLSIDNQQCVVLLLLDLSSAFDTVDHGILLQRLSTNFGIKGKALDWFTSYLTDRSQFVQIDVSESDKHSLLCGVPQGSVLGPILYLLYTSPLSDILRRHNMSFHFYADDIQLYTTFTYNNEFECNNTTTRLHNCLADIDTWMTLNRLKLNKEKTELLVLHSRHRPPPAFASLKIGSEVILPSDSARNVGVIFDNTMTMVPHINSTCKSAFYHLRNIARIRKFISLKTTETLVHAFVNSKLDYCNSLAYGLPKYLLQKLQYVQNAAARLITGIRKHDHITPILMDLHWLPVNERIQFKILLLTFKSLNGLAPVYIDEMIQRYVPNRKLRSSSAFLLKQNKWNLKSYGFRTFTVAAPFLWNSLPLEVKASPSLNTFKSNLKTHLFKCAFNLN